MVEAWLHGVVEECYYELDDAGLKFHVMVDYGTRCCPASSGTVRETG